MRNIILLLIFIGGIYLLVHQKKSNNIDLKKLEEVKKEEIKNYTPSLPTEVKSEMMLSFSKKTIETLKKLTLDSNENVRFASLELLWKLKDKDIDKVVKRSFETETETEIKIKIIDMLAQEKSKLSLKLISYALTNYDEKVRIRACEVLGDFVDKETIDVLTPSLKDYNEQVKLAALRSIDKIKKAIEQERERKLKETTSPKPLFQIEDK